MKLSGNYQLADLVQTFQGHFNCFDNTKNSKGKAIEDKYIRLELFFVAFAIHYAINKRVEIQRISDDGGIKKYDTLLTLKGE